MNNIFPIQIIMITPLRICFYIQERQRTPLRHRVKKVMCLATRDLLLTRLVFYQQGYPGLTYLRKSPINLTSFVTGFSAV